MCPESAFRGLKSWDGIINFISGNFLSFVEMAASPTWLGWGRPQKGSSTQKSTSHSTLTHSVTFRHFYRLWAQT